MDRCRRTGWCCAAPSASAPCPHSPGSGRTLRCCRPRARWLRCRQWRAAVVVPDDPLRRQGSGPLGGVEAGSGELVVEDQLPARVAGGRRHAARGRCWLSARGAADGSSRRTALCGGGRTALLRSCAASRSNHRQTGQQTKEAESAELVSPFNCRLELSAFARLMAKSDVGLYQHLDENQPVRCARRLPGQRCESVFSTGEGWVHRLARTFSRADGFAPDARQRSGHTCSGITFSPSWL